MILAMVPHNSARKHVCIHFPGLGSKSCVQAGRLPHCERTYDRTKCTTPRSSQMQVPLLCQILRKRLSAEGVHIYRTGKPKPNTNYETMQQAAGVILVEWPFFGRRETDQKGSRTKRSITLVKNEGLYSRLPLLSMLTHSKMRHEHFAV